MTIYDKMLTNRCFFYSCVRIQIQGLLNDGSAMVFFTIFVGLFLNELGIDGVGTEVDLAQGFALFFRMSLGGAAVGMAFAISLIFILYTLDRRLVTTDSIVQVCSTITVAYLCYYTADTVCATSGVIATLTCGVMTQAFGNAMINDPVRMDAFWGLVEQYFLSTTGRIAVKHTACASQAMAWPK